MPLITKRCKRRGTSETCQPCIAPCTERSERTWGDEALHNYKPRRGFASHAGGVASAKTSPRLLPEDASQAPCTFATLRAWSYAQPAHRRCAHLYYASLLFGVDCQEVLQAAYCIVTINRLILQGHGSKHFGHNPRL